MDFLSELEEWVILTVSVITSLIRIRIRVSRSITMLRDWRRFSSSRICHWVQSDLMGFGILLNGRGINLQLILSRRRCQWQIGRICKLHKKVNLPMIQHSLFDVPRIWRGNSEAHLEITSSLTDRPRHPQYSRRDHLLTQAKDLWTHMTTV